MTFDEIATFAEDPVFISRIRAAIVSYARTVLAESAAVEGHAYRVRYARAILRSSLVAAQNMAYAVAADAEFTENASDELIVGIIACLWNEFAGV